MKNLSFNKDLCVETSDLDNEPRLPGDSWRFAGSVSSLGSNTEPQSTAVVFFWLFELKSQVIKNDEIKITFQVNEAFS